MSHDIFISYSRDDQQRMQHIRDALEESGLTVWTDTGIKPGTESWKQAIAAAIKGCKAVVVLFSPDAAQSTWVNRELDYAELHKKKIYPMLVRGNEAESVPFGYTTYQFIDIRDEDAVDDGIVALLTTMQGALLQSGGIPVSVMSDIIEGRAPGVEASDEMSSEDQEEPDKLMTWRWVDGPGFSMTIPATWKINEPTEENLRKLQFIMSGKDDRLFFRLIESTSNLGYILTGGIRGTEIEHSLLVRDISGMTPVAMYVGTLYPPAYVQFPNLILPRLVPMIRRRATAIWKEHYDAEITALEASRTSNGVVLRGVGHSNELGPGAFPVRGSIHLMVPRGSRRWLVLLITSEASRFETEIGVYDRMARSIQLMFRSSCASLQLSQEIDRIR